MERELYSVKRIDKHADIFENGRVIVRHLFTAEGSRCALGLVLPGEYEITIEDSETVEVLGGDFSIMLPGSDEYKTYKEGETFYVPKNGTYKMIVKDYFDYYCVFDE